MLESNGLIAAVRTGSIASRAHLGAKRSAIAVRAIVQRPRLELAPGQMHRVVLLILTPPHSLPLSGYRVSATVVSARRRTPPGNAVANQRPGNRHLGDSRRKFSLCDSCFCRWRIDLAGWQRRGITGQPKRWTPPTAVGAGKSEPQWQQAGFALTAEQNSMKRVLSVITLLLIAAAVLLWRLPARYCASRFPRARPCRAVAPARRHGVAWQHVGHGLVCAACLASCVDMPTRVVAPSASPANSATPLAAT